MATTIYGSRLFKDSITLAGAKELRFADSDSSNYAAIKAPSTIGTNYTLTLPADDGTSGQVLSSDGSGVLSWASVLTASLATSNLFIGNGSGVATATDTASLGDILATSAGALEIKAGAIVNADINASAAIAYSKLALTGSIVNADISASAAIAYSKLALTGAILNADLAAGIDAVKIADGSVSNTEFQYLNGVTSAIQTQISSKTTKVTAVWADTDGATKTVVHNLGTKSIVLAVYDKSTDELIEVDSIVRTDTNTIDLVASEAPNASGWDVIIVG